MTDNPPQDERKGMRKDALSLFAGGMGASVFAAVEVVLLARFLGLGQFGLFSLVLSYVGLVNVFVDFKIGNASVKYVSEYREKGDAESVRSFIKLFYLIDLASGILAFCVCVAFAGIANEFFIKSEGSFQYVIILSFALLVSTVNQNSQAILQSFKKFKQSGVFSVFHNFVRLVLITVAYFADQGLKGFFAAYVIAAVLNFTVLQFFVNQSLVREGMGGWLFADLARIRGKMREALWFVFNTGVSGFLSLSFSAHVPILMLGYFSGAEASGLYKVARNVIKISEKIIVPGTSVLYPAMVKARTSRSLAEMKKIIVYSVRQVVKFLFPVSVLLFVFAEQIIGLFFGAEFVAASGAMRIFIITGLLYGMFFWTSSALFTFEMSGFNTLVNFLSAILTLAALLTLVPIYSYYGASFASLIYITVHSVGGVFMFVRILRREN